MTFKLVIITSQRYSLETQEKESTPFGNMSPVFNFYQIMFVHNFFFF